MQSFSFPFGHPAKSWLADGQIDPSGQQELPAHFVIPAPGQVTASPTLQDAGLGGLGGCGGLGGPGGVGGIGGLGAGDGPSVQSFSFFLGAACEGMAGRRANRTIWTTRIACALLGIAART